MWVGKVPTDAGTRFFAASEPATASAGMAHQNRLNSIAMPPTMVVERVGAR